MLLSVWISHQLTQSLLLVDLLVISAKTPAPALEKIAKLHVKVQEIDASLLLPSEDPTGYKGIPQGLPQPTENLPKKLLQK